MDFTASISSGTAKKRKISNDDEIVRIYEIHHPLLEEYKDMATGIRKTVNKITAIYFLGIIAVFCVMFFIDNLLSASSPSLATCLPSSS